MKNEIKDIINAMPGVANEADARDGQIYLANAPVTAVPGATEHLTQFAVRYSAEDNNAAARRHLAPDCAIVTDGATFEYRYWPLDEALITPDYDSLRRAAGGDYKGVSDRSELRTSSLEDIGLCVAVETRHLQAIPGYREALIRKMTNIIERATLIKTLEIFADIAEDSTISLASDKNPDAKLRAILTDAVIRPNRALYGPKAWDLRCTAYENADLTAGALRAAETTDQLGNRLGLDILVPNGRKATSAGAYPYICAEKVLLGFATDGASTEDQSNIKVFRQRAGFDVYESDHPQGKKKLISVSTSQKILVTSAAGAYAVKIAA